MRRTIMAMALLAAWPTWASEIPASSIATAVLPATIVEEDLSAGAVHVHPTFGYIHSSNDFGGAFGTGSTSTRGFGGTLQSTYSFSSHFGISLAGLRFITHGTYTPGAVNPSGASGEAATYGTILSNMLIYDPFEGDGFRLPFVFGPNYEWLDTNTPTTGDLLSVSLRSLGWSAGVSPRFNLGSLVRVQPFFIANITFDTPKAFCSATSPNCPSYDRNFEPVAGINLVYLPWGVSVYIDASAMLTKNGAAYMALGKHF